MMDEEKKDMKDDECPSDNDSLKFSYNLHNNDNFKPENKEEITEPNYPVDLNKLQMNVQN